MKTLGGYLHRYLNELSRAPRSISISEIRELVESAPHRGVRIQQPLIRWRNIMIASTVIIGIVVGVALVAPPSDRAERRAPVPARTPAPTLSHGTGPAAVASQAAPAGTLPDDASPAHPAHSHTDVYRAAMFGHPAVDVPSELADDRTPARTKPEDELPKEGNAAESAPDAAYIDVSGVRLIELPADAMEKLGLRADDDGVWVTSVAGNMPVHVGIGGTQVHTQPERLAALDLPQAPEGVVAMITDDLGHNRLFTYDSNEVAADLRHALAAEEVGSEEWIRLTTRIDAEVQANLRRTAGTMIPVLVRTGRLYSEADSASGRWRPDCIVWFRTVPSVLERLPEDVRSRISVELVELKRREEGAATQADAGTTGERPYIELLRASSGAITATELGPNPARERTELVYSLADARSAGVTIVDVAGRPVRRVEPSAPREAGTRRVAIDLAGLTPGVYLVAVTTDRGEQAVQRLIVPE